jgi:hypothetical protein
MLSVFYVTYRSVCETYLARVLTFVRGISLFRRLETVEFTKRSLLGDMAVSNNSNKMYLHFTGRCICAVLFTFVQLFRVSCHQGAIFVNNIECMWYYTLSLTEPEFQGQEFGRLFPVVRLQRSLVTGRLQVQRGVTDCRTRKASITLTDIFAFSVPYIMTQLLQRKPTNARSSLESMHVPPMRSCTVILNWTSSV